MQCCNKCLADRGSGAIPRPDPRTKGFGCDFSTIGTFRASETAAKGSAINQTFGFKTKDLEEVLDVGSVLCVPKSVLDAFLPEAEFCAKFRMLSL